jgi:hypothetical protein
VALVIIEEILEWKDAGKDFILRYWADMHYHDRAIINGRALFNAKWVLGVTYENDSNRDYALGRLLGSAQG